MSDETRRILGNRDVIAIDQDALGQQGRRLWKDGDQEIWARPLAGGDVAVILFNRGALPTPMHVTWAQLNLPPRSKATVKDLWSHRVTRDVRAGTGGPVAPHGVLMLRITPSTTS